MLSDTPLYRIMPLSRFEEMIERNQNTLVKPSLWSDPYESITKHCKVEINNLDYPLDASHWFGQSWSLCKESALMWQAYAPQIKKDDKDNIRYVKIMVRSFNLIKNLQNEDRLQIAILDKLRYFSETENDFESKIHEVIGSHGWPQNFLKHGKSFIELFPLFTLLTKRDVFKHEEELRLLVFDDSTSKNLLKYTFEANDLVEEVVLDPWTSIDDAESIIPKLRKSLTNENIQISKSTLFSEDLSKYYVRFKI